MSNTNSQDELLDFIIDKVVYMTTATVAGDWREHTKKQLRPRINAHTQKAVTEAKIEELRKVQFDFVKYPARIIVDGKPISIEQRIATLTNQPNGSGGL